MINYSNGKKYQAKWNIEKKKTKIKKKKKKKMKDARRQIHLTKRTSLIRKSERSSVFTFFLTARHLAFLRITENISMKSYIFKSVYYRSQSKWNIKMNSVGSICYFIFCFFFRLIFCRMQCSKRQMGWKSLSNYRDGVHWSISGWKQFDNSSHHLVCQRNYDGRRAFSRSVACFSFLLRSN